ncbi:MAG TPA: SPOR domain-containing protein [Usitatibacter sp.]|nr:SPOR domain-containing protein [Usitatibacter sp.]
MPKDYKDAPAARGGSRLNHPLLLGVIIGLLLGIVISLAVALWLNRLANPFVQKNRPVEPLPRLNSVQPPPPEEAAKAAQRAAQGAVPDKGAKPGERPRFEFYQILPGEKEAAPRPAPKVAEPAAKAPETPAKRAEAPRPGSSPATPKPHGTDVYWLQAGAFSDEKEADNLRAKIALTGLEASVRSVATPDKGKLYRVRLGPYQSVEDANRIKATLSQNGVAAAIIRTGDDAKNP